MESIARSLSSKRRSPTLPTNQDFTRQQRRQSQLYDESPAPAENLRHSPQRLSWLSNKSLGLIWSKDGVCKDSSTPSCIDETRDFVLPVESSCSHNKYYQDEDGALLTMPSRQETISRARLRSQRRKRNSSHEVTHDPGLHAGDVGQEEELHARFLSPFSDSAIEPVRMAVNISGPAPDSDDEWMQSVQKLIQETRKACWAVSETFNHGDLTSWQANLPNATTPQPQQQIPTPSNDLTTDRPYERVFIHKKSSSDSDMYGSLPRSICSKISPFLYPEHDAEVDLNTKIKMEVSYSPVGQQRTKSVRWTVPDVSTQKEDNIQPPTSAVTLKRSKSSISTMTSGITQILNHRFRRVKAYESMDPDRANNLRHEKFKTQRKGTKMVEDTINKTPATAPLSDAVTHVDFSATNKSSQTGNLLQTVNSRAAKSSTDIETSNTRLCSKSSARHSSIKQHNERLPTIPEVMLFKIEGFEEAAGRPSEDGSPESESSGKSDGLPCMPLSAFNTSYRDYRTGGQVVDPFKKNSLSTGASTSNIIDACAFQTAVLGVTDDLQVAVYDDDELADDLMEWFSTFGFESGGQLISGWESSSSHNAIISTSFSSTCSSVDTSVLDEQQVSFLTEPMRFLQSQAPRAKWTAPVSRMSTRHSSGDGTRQTYGMKVYPLVVGDGEMGDVSEQVADLAPLGMSMKQDEFWRWRTAQMHAM